MDITTTTDHGADGACGDSSGSTPTHLPPDYQDVMTSLWYQVVGGSRFTTPKSDDREIRFHRGNKDNTDGAETTLKEVAGIKVEGQRHTDLEAQGPENSAPHVMQSPVRMQERDGPKHRLLEDEGERYSQ